MPIELFIISVYCLIEDLFKKVTPPRIRRRGFAPHLSDPEVITMEIVGEFLGMDQDTQIHRYFREHWLSFFPRLGDRTSFVRQCANLWAYKKKLQEQFSVFNKDIRIVDGFPMPLCHFKRAHDSKRFRGEAAYGYCAAKDQPYYGFKGHLLTDTEGRIIDVVVSAANVDEREALFDMSSKIPGFVLGDKGYLSKEVTQQEYQAAGFHLLTPVRSNMVDPLPKEQRTFWNKTRRLVETVIGQLCERFHIEKIRARDSWHLLHRTIRKILSHTVCFFLNQQLGNPGLQLERLLTP